MMSMVGYAKFWVLGSGFWVKQCYVLQNTESWLSGRKRLTANEVSPNRDRGFESHTLRQLELARDASEMTRLCSF